MKKVNAINFLKENRKEDKYFICMLLILTFILVYQGISYIKSIKILEEEVSQIKSSITKVETKEVEVEKSTLLDDTKEVYDILGVTNVDTLSINNNEVKLEGECEDLSVLDKLKSMKNVRDVSIDSVEKKDSKYLFKVVYQIGGANESEK